MKYPKMAVAVIALCMLLLGVYVIDEVSVAQDGIAVEAPNCEGGTCQQPATATALHAATGYGCGTSQASRYATTNQRRRMRSSRPRPIRAWVARAFGARSSCGG